MLKNWTKYNAQRKTQRNANYNAQNGTKYNPQRKTQRIIQRTKMEPIQPTTQSATQNTTHQMEPVADPGGGAHRGATGARLLNFDQLYVFFSGYVSECFQIIIR